MFQTHTSHEVLKGRVEGAQHPAEWNIQCDVNVNDVSEAEPGKGPEPGVAKVFPSSALVRAEGGSGTRLHS